MVNPEPTHIKLTPDRVEDLEAAFASRIQGLESGRGTEDYDERSNWLKERQRELRQAKENCGTLVFDIRPVSDEYDITIEAQDYEAEVTDFADHLEVEAVYGSRRTGTSFREFEFDLTVAEEPTQLGNRIIEDWSITEDSQPGASENIPEAVINNVLVQLNEEHAFQVEPYLFASN